MNDYIEVRIEAIPCSETATDLLAAFLADEGYESFVPDSNGLTAYIRKEAFTPEALERVISEMPIDAQFTCSHNLIEGQDWNSEWEKHYFQPIVIGDECVVHSSFHTDVPQCKYDIAIDPKMAFGTGHHATTSHMAEQLLQRDISGLTVIDMGTGTGILAILAAMRGAAKVIAVEIDPVAHANAVENLRINNADAVTDLRLGDVAAISGVNNADLLLANINRNIIVNDIKDYAAALRHGATMLLSGFYTDDIPVVTEAADAAGLKFETSTERDRWACAVYTKK